MKLSSIHHEKSILFLGGWINLYSQAIGWLAWLHNEINLKISNLSLCRKIFENCRFVQNFPPVPEIMSQTLTDPSFGYGIFVKKDLAEFLKYFILPVRQSVSPISCAYVSNVLSPPPTPYGKNRFLRTQPKYFFVFYVFRCAYQKIQNGLKHKLLITYLRTCPLIIGFFTPSLSDTLKCLLWS